MQPLHGGGHRVHLSRRDRSRVAGALHPFNTRPPTRAAPKNNNNQRVRRFRQWRKRKKGSLYPKGANLRVAVVLGVQVGRHFGGALWYRAAALTSSQLSLLLLHCRLSPVYRTRTLLGLARRRVRRTTHDSALSLGRPNVGGRDRIHSIPSLRRGISLNFTPICAPQIMYAIT